MKRPETKKPNHRFKDEVTSTGNSFTIRVIDSEPLTHQNAIFLFGSKITNEQLMFMARGGVLIFRENKWVESHDSN